MNKIIKSEPAKYPETSVPESKTITIFRYIIEERNVKADLKEMDKIPNYDGYLELTEDDQSPIGKIEVQLKTLDEKDSDNPQYQCDLKFLSYCEGSVLPVFLIAIDIKNELAYWVWVNQELLEKLEIKEGAKSTLIKFPKENIIKKGNSDYLTKWKEITSIYKIKLFGYDSLKEAHDTTKKAYNILLENSEPTLGLEKDEFTKIHEFLDTLNVELDTNFKAVKNFFYQPCWKIGLAYSDYTDKKVFYILYPIPPSKNDVQIKNTTPEKGKELALKKGLGFSGHFTENPIHQRPQKYALEVIHSKLKQILEIKALPIRNITLAREFIFSFIDEYNIPLGLEIKDKYNLDEIIFAFSTFLPIWVEESLKEKRVVLGRSRFIDPSFVLSQIADDKRKKISKKIKERLAKEEYGLKQAYPIGSHKFPLGLLKDLLVYLKENNIHELKRLYIPKDHSRRIKGKPAFIWSFLTPEEVKNNIETFFWELPIVYDILINHYFPTLQPELRFFKDFDRMIVIIDVKEEYQNWEDCPGIDIYYLKEKEKRELKLSTTDIYLKNDKNIPKGLVPDKPNTLFDSEIDINGIKYQVHSASYSVLRFIFEELPMLDYIYKLLAERFDSYFKEKINLLDISKF